jgi:uncharacterized protein (DUF1501 family)
MHLLQPELHSRRAFLKRSGQLAMTGTALPFALNLAAMGEAAAFNSTGGDYKALVCVFLYGGNDYGNTVVPYDNTNYDLYSTIRGGANRAAGGIALGQAALTPTRLTPSVAPTDSQGSSTRQFALNPSMTAMAGLFNAGRAAVQLNVGPLVKPLTRAQYENTDHVLYPRPPQLFSHNDQQSIWQSSSPEGSTIGWGGNMADLALSLNTASTFTCISVTGNAVFLSGDTALQYQVSTNGAIKIYSAVNPSTTYVYGSTAVATAMNALLQQSSGHALENEYNKVTTRALAAESLVTSVLGQTPPTTVFGSDSLAQQLKMVARLIKGRSTLGARRQVFMVSLGGFDLHDNLIAQHGGLLGNVSDAMAAFYNATVEMGVANDVTAFTASDFGRTLASNGDGSDHGWGSHHFVVGGAVNGAAATQGRFYGTAPPISTSDAKTGGVYNPENQWHVGQGRLLPSTSVDQYAATLAKWFGVDPSEMAGVLPNSVNFGGAGYPLDLGFMG